MWIREKNGLCEYIIKYVDDLIITSSDTEDLSDRDLYILPTKYIEIYMKKIEEKPKIKCTPQQEKGDCTDLDISNELEDINSCNSKVSFPWNVSHPHYSHITINFSIQSKKSQMLRNKRVLCYITKMKQGAIRFRTELPYYSDIPYNIYIMERNLFMRM